MKEYLDVIIKSLNSYYGKLSYIGYVRNEDVYKLLILSFIDDMLLTESSGIFTAEDYKDIAKYIICMCGDSCIIKYPDFNVTDSLIRRSEYKDTRITEGSILRVTDSEVQRVTA